MIRFLLACLLCAAGLAGAAEPGPSLREEANARRFHTLTQELRCVVCQNESLADSTAPLALDLKHEIRTRMDEGQSDDQIRAFLVERYGDFVTYRPPVKAATAVLWLGPLVFVALGVLVLLRRSRRKPNATTEPAAHEELK